MESEAQRILGDEERRTVGLATARTPARSAREARRLAERGDADFALWGEVIAFKGEVEVQPSLTPVAQSGGAGPKLGSLLFQPQAGSPIEVRRKGATRIAEAVARLAAQRALDRGDAPGALRLLQ